MRLSLNTVRPGIAACAVALAALAAFAPGRGAGSGGARSAGPRQPAAGAVVERRLACMGTALVLEVHGPSRGAALAASEAAVREIERVEALLTTWRSGGPLESVNAAAPGRDVRVPGELAGLLEETFAWSARTGGAFDPTVRPLVACWDLRGRGRVPDEAELLAARAATGVSRFRLSEGEAVRKDSDAAGIDEGAWGKGYALDRALAALEAAGAESGVVDLGGQVAVFGGESRGVDLADPRSRSRRIATIPLHEGSVSTSGDSERSREVAGRRIGHILDPRTGAPAPDFGSVSVVAPSALTADILSTAFFVLGPDRGLELSASLRAEGVPNEAVFIVATSGGLLLRASPAFAHLDVAEAPRTDGLARERRERRERR